MKLPLRLFQIVLILAAAGLFVFLGNKEFVPRGALTITHEVGEASPFLSRFLPDTRTEEVFIDAEGRSVHPIIGDPTYVTLTPPSDFETIEMELTYQNQDVPVVELGILTNVETDAYQLKPLQNTLLDELNWKQVREGEVVLYDRRGDYETLADFLVDAPPLEEIAAYHYRFDRPFALSGYQPSAETRSVDISLRGEHEFLTYVQNEQLNFTFNYQDMNRTLGQDPVTILVFDTSGELVASKAIPDDGNTGTNGIGSERRDITIQADLPDGVYKFVLKVNRDVFFRRITTTQQKVTFLNQVFLGDEVGYQVAPRSARLVTEAKSLSFETQHAEGVQTVNVARVPVVVDEPFVQTRHRVRAPGIVSMTVPKGDLFVRGAGHYAFSESMYFNPDPVRLEWDTDLDALGVNYVIATYTPPEQDGDLVRAQATFSTQHLPKVRDAWKFALSMPGIYDHGGFIDLHKTTATLTREPLSLGRAWQKAWRKMVSFF